MLHYLLNFLYPPRCAVCDAALPIETRRRVCARCLGAVEPLRPPLCLLCGAPLQSAEQDDRCAHCRDAPPAFDSARAVTRYRSGAEGSNTVGALLRRHKYGLDQSLEIVSILFVHSLLVLPPSQTRQLPPPYRGAVSGRGDPPIDDYRLSYPTSCV